MKKIDRFDEHPNYYLNLCEAAKVLSYVDYRRIESFIDNGYLKAYQMPHTNRKKVRYHDLMNMLTQKTHNSENV